MSREEKGVTTKEQPTPASVPEGATPIRMPPQIWGPIFWSTLHIASLAYSDKPSERQKRNMRNFYESMVDVLPCPICRQHYEDNLKELPLDDALNSRMDLVIWVWNMHNKINLQLGKREFTFGEFIESMQNLEKSKKAVPPSFHYDNVIKKLESNFDTLKFNIFDKILLGTGLSLIASAGMYYLYQEIIRKATK
jgi:hypothetical protein